MSILQDIYDDRYKPGEAAEKLPFALRLEKRAFLDAIEETMGEEFINRHLDGLCGLIRFRDHASFREGFRLGGGADAGAHGGQIKIPAAEAAAGTESGKS